MQVCTLYSITQICPFKKGVTYFGFDAVPHATNHVYRFWWKSNLDQHCFSHWTTAHPKLTTIQINIKVNATTTQGRGNILTMKRQSQEVILALDRPPDARDLNCNTIS